MSKNSGEKLVGQSKYAKKVAKHKRAARRLGLPSNTSWPIIWMAMDGLDVLDHLLFSQGLLAKDDND